MSFDDDFYNKFNTNSPKKSNFKSGILVPFASGVLGASLVLGITLGVPNIRNTILSNTNIPSTSSTAEQTPKSRNS